MHIYLLTVRLRYLTDWAAKCSMVEFVLNSSVSTTTGFTPFEQNQGYMPQIGMPTSFDTTFKGVKQFTLQAKWT